MPVRSPLFAELLLPALARGVRDGLPGCARWTARLLPLGRGQHDRLLLPEGARWPSALFRMALELDPEDCASRHHLIEELSSALDYATHEVPAGILWDEKGVSTVEQLDELLAEVAEMELHMEISGVREVQGKNLVDLAEFCRFHLTAYRGFLEGHPEGESYHEYLDRTYTSASGTRH